jgi:8-oxo-dGTP pyrophosphatase MutT (NUDIX family)
MASAPESIQQAAAIPLRAGRICLVTSSSGKRWVIPKGCVEPGKTAVEIALQEAWEEAGLVGRIDPDPVGTYLYEKWDRLHHVTVFLMKVTRAVDDWPERLRRERCWLTTRQALFRIEEEGLRELIRDVVEARSA